MKTNQFFNLERQAGLSYFLLIPFGVFGILFIPSYFIDADNVSVTIEKIAANEQLFRLGILGGLLTQVIQVFVALKLNQLFKKTHGQMALFMMVSVLMGVPIAMVNELNYFAVLESLGNEEQVTMFLSIHDYGLQIAQIFWGLWLFPMGALVYKAVNLPKWIGILLILAGAGYMTDSFVALLGINIEVVFSEFTFIGELALVFWLLVKGGK